MINLFFTVIIKYFIARVELIVNIKIKKRNELRKIFTFKNGFIFIMLISYLVMYCNNSRNKPYESNKNTDNSYQWMVLSLF